MNPNGFSGNMHNRQRHPNPPNDGQMQRYQGFDNSLAMQQSGVNRAYPAPAVAPAYAGMQQPIQYQQLPDNAAMGYMLPAPQNQNGIMVQNWNWGNSQPDINGYVAPDNYGRQPVNVQHYSVPNGNMGGVGADNAVMPFAPVYAQNNMPQFSAVPHAGMTQDQANFSRDMQHGAALVRAHTAERNQTQLQAELLDFYRADNTRLRAEVDSEREVSQNLRNQNNDLREENEEYEGALNFFSRETEDAQTRHDDIQRDFNVTRGQLRRVVRNYNTARGALDQTQQELTRTRDAFGPFRGNDFVLVSQGQDDLAEFHYGQYDNGTVALMRLHGGAWEANAVAENGSIAVRFEDINPQNQNNASPIGNNPRVIEEDEQINDAAGNHIILD